MADSLNPELRFKNIQQSSSSGVLLLVSEAQPAIVFVYCRCQRLRGEQMVMPVVKYTRNSSRVCLSEYLDNASSLKEHVLQHLYIFSCLYQRYILSAAVMFAKMFRREEHHLHWGLIYSKVASDSAVPTTMIITSTQYCLLHQEKRSIKLENCHFFLITVFSLLWIILRPHCDVIWK